MTTWVFQGVFALFAVVLAVLFQEELRRGFEALAAWVLGRRQDARPRLDAPHILVEGLTDLARRRIGALVVLPGLHPLRRHLRGGSPLDGQLSLPLLQSLFDPHSDGHDGAVLVENRRVTLFGVQLPLSRDVDKLNGRGTRHCAALGLAERTDALCVVVSEERGAISLARAGALFEVRSEDQLRAEIEKFYKETLPLARQGQPWLRWVSAHRREKLAALATSAAVWWILVSGAERMAIPYRVPVELANVPADAQVEELEPSHVDAVVQGRRRALVWLGGRGLALKLDASSARDGDNRQTVSSEDLVLPWGVQVLPFEPVGVAFQLRLPDVSSNGAAENGH